MTRSYPPSADPRRVVTQTPRPQTQTHNEARACPCTSHAHIRRKKRGTLVECAHILKISAQTGAMRQLNAAYAHILCTDRSDKAQDGSSRCPPRVVGCKCCANILLDLDKWILCGVQLKPLRNLQGIKTHTHTPSVMI